MRRGVVASAEAYTESGDPGAVVVTLDRLLHSHLLELAREGRFILDYLRLSADVENLRTFARLRVLGEGRPVLESSFLEGGEIKLETLVGMLGDDRDAVAARFRLTRFNRMVEEGMEHVAKKKTFLRLERLGREEGSQIVVYGMGGYDEHMESTIAASTAGAADWLSRSGVRLAAVTPSRHLAPGIERLELDQLFERLAST